LEYRSDDFDIILKELTAKNIIIYNSEASNYELNYENKTPYYFSLKQKFQIRKLPKKSGERDYGIIVEACISRILKKKKSVQKTDLSKLLNG
jgi:hypothetical protein